jgi:Family of unknown function (DUF5652)
MQPFTPLYSPFAPGLMLALIPLVVVIALWTIILKGYALWHAARNTQKWWFIALLVINTLGILEIIYLIWYRPKSGIKETTPAHESSVQA